MNLCARSSKTAFVYFRDSRAFRYDEVNAAMAAGWSDLVDLENRLSACSASVRLPISTSRSQLQADQEYFASGGIPRRRCF